MAEKTIGECLCCICNKITSLSLVTSSILSKVNEIDTELDLTELTNLATETNSYVKSIDNKVDSVEDLVKDAKEVLEDIKDSVDDIEKAVKCDCECDTEEK